MKLWSSQQRTQFQQLRREAGKIQEFMEVETRDLAMTVHCPNQLTYEARNGENW